MRIIITNILTLFILLGCTSTSNTVTKDRSSVGVDIESKSRALIIDVAESTGDSNLGPLPKNDQDAQESSVKKTMPAIAIFIPDAQEIIPISLGIMRELSKNGIVPRIYAGVGVGAAIATAFAFNMSADEIEWELFSLERQGKNAARDKAQALLTPFLDKDLGQSFHVLAIPNNKGIWVRRGQIEKVTKMHLENIGKNVLRARVPRGKFDADLVFLLTTKKVSEQVAIIKNEIKKFAKK